MESRIVVSIDPINTPHNVIDYALGLASAAQKQLLIYSVQGMPMLSESDGSLASVGINYIPGAIEEAQRIAEQRYEEVLARYSNTILEHGPGFRAVATIQKMAEIQDTREGLCMLVMEKSHGHNWWNMFFGTTETSVAEGVACPVLFVPNGAEYHGISRIMYLADTQALMDGRYKGFRFLRSFADSHKANIVVGFTYDPKTDDKQQLRLGEAMDEFKQNLPFQFTHEYRFFQHHNADEILELANMTHTDIVAFPLREAGVLQRFFESEMTHALVLKANLPVLVF